MSCSGWNPPEETSRVLVTGGYGFVGSHLAEHLHKNGWDVVVTDLESSRRDIYYTSRKEPTGGDMPEPSHFESVLDQFNIEFIPADLTERDEVERLFGQGGPYDVVFHTASLYDYFAERDILDKVNVEGGRNIASIALENGIRHFVHWSTLGVCGGSESESEPILEDAEYSPHNRYGESKVEQERMMFDFAENGLPLTVLRPAPVYGPRHTYGIYHLFYLYRKVGTGFVWPIYPRNEQLHFPSVHVSDVVRAAEFVTHHRPETLGEVYHVASDPILQDEFIEFMTEALGLRRRRIPMPWPLYRLIANRLIDIAKILEQRARKNDTRPKFPMSMAQYLTRDFWYVSDKLRSLGFEFKYRDPRRGLWDYVTWCKERGLL